MDAGLYQLFRLEEHARAADVFGLAFMPTLFAKAAITKRQVELESLSAGGDGLIPALRGMAFHCLSGHSNLRGNGACIEHFAHFVFQVAKVEGLLEEA